MLSVIICCISLFLLFNEESTGTPIMLKGGEEAVALGEPLLTMNDSVEESLADGYYKEPDEESLDVQQIILQDENEPIDTLLKDFKVWARKAYIKQIGSDPTEEELEDYMYDMVTFLL